MSHGNIDRLQIVVLDDRVALDDFQGARISPDATARAVDVAQMLVATAIAVGPERAISAARAGIGDEQLRAALPVVQSFALSAELQGDVKQSGLKLKELRKSLAETTDMQEPELAQLTRVTWGQRRHGRSGRLRGLRADQPTR